MLLLGRGRGGSGAARRALCRAIPRSLMPRAWLTELGGSPVLLPAAVAAALAALAAPPRLARPGLVRRDDLGRPAARRAAEGLDDAAAPRRARAARADHLLRLPERPCRQCDDGLARRGVPARTGQGAAMGAGRRRARRARWSASPGRCSASTGRATSSPAGASASSGPCCWSACPKPAERPGATGIFSAKEKDDGQDPA